MDTSITLINDRTLLTEAKLVKRKPTIGKSPHSKLTKTDRIKHSNAYKRHGKHNAMKIHGPECFNLTRMWNEFLIKKTPEFVNDYRKNRSI